MIALKNCNVIKALLRIWKQIYQYFHKDGLMKPYELGDILYYRLVVENADMEVDSGVGIISAIDVEHQCLRLINDGFYLVNVPYTIVVDEDNNVWNTYFQLLGHDEELLKEYRKLFDQATILRDRCNEASYNKG